MISAGVYADPSAVSRPHCAGVGGDTKRLGIHVQEIRDRAGYLGVEGRIELLWEENRLSQGFYATQPLSSFQR